MKSTAQVMYLSFTKSVLLLLFIAALPTITIAASLSVSPATGVYQSGATFTVQVAVNTQGKQINAADGTVSFNPRELQVVSVTRASSIFNLWTSEPSFSNSAGTITFSGGSPSGYTGSFGNVMTITFRTVGSGTSRVSIINGSVLAADGQGTNVLTSMNGGNYTISAVTTTPQPEVIVEYVPPPNTPAAPVVTSPTHPVEDAWSTSTRATFRWNLPGSVTAVRTLLTTAPSAVPSRVYEPPVSSITLDDVADGTSYFYVQFRNADGWGRVARYRINIDSKPMPEFTFSVATTSSANKILAFSTEDVVISPLRSYEVVIPGYDKVVGDLDSEQTTITLPILPPGTYTVVVTLFNAAGRSYTSSVTFTVDAFPAPLVTQAPDRLTERTVPVVSGLTEAFATVTLVLTKANQSPREFVGEADGEGRFTIVFDEPLTRGTYQFRLSATAKDGSQSDVSPAYQFLVEEPGYIALGMFVVNILSVLVTMVALLVLLVLLTMFGYRKLLMMRRRVSKESKEVDIIVKERFLQLKHTLQQETAAMMKSRKTGNLTKSETHLISTLEELMVEAEAEITKEVSDVIRLVDKK